MLNVHKAALLGLLVAGMSPVNPGDPVPKEPAAKARVTAFIPAILPLDGGHVVNVSKESITIRTTVRKELVRYPFHVELAAGRVHEYAKGVTGYRAQDIQVGDEVWLGICTEEGKKFCAEISIRKRPAGRVPEAHVDGHKPSYAARRNADNDIADFGIPIPNEFKSVRPIVPEIDEKLEKYLIELNAKIEAQVKGQKPPVSKQNP